MNCRQAWDYAYACQSPQGQWNAVYRYGSVRKCSEQWEDFWFCMRTKGYDGKVKEDMIREHYRAKEARKYGAGKPSSEDVWDSRTEKVAPGTVFSLPFENPTVSDAEFQQAEMEKRWRIKQEMGIGNKERQM
jgi:hypothetical protein